MFLTDIKMALSLSLSLSLSLFLCKGGGGGRVKGVSAFFLLPRPFPEYFVFKVDKTGDSLLKVKYCKPVSHIC